MLKQPKYHWKDTLNIPEHPWTCREMCCWPSLRVNRIYYSMWYRKTLSVCHLSYLPINSNNHQQSFSLEPEMIIILGLKQLIIHTIFTYIFPSQTSPKAPTPTFGCWEVAAGLGWHITSRFTQHWLCCFSPAHVDWRIPCSRHRFDWIWFLMKILFQDQNFSN